MAGLLTALTATIGLVGCEDAYSASVHYTLRTDPLVLKTDEFGPEQTDPDRPDVLPLLSMKDLNNPANPMYPNREKLEKSDALRDPTLLPKIDKEELKGKLDELFGSSPRSPRVKDAPASLELDDEKLAEGSKLYRVHCLHCHGVTGDGRGVTARWVNPHPRDFRQGIFKFESVDQTSGPLPPRREDLRRTLMHGVEGTAMPAFNLLSPREIDNLVSYVIHLSIRGKLEFDVIRNVFEMDRETNQLVPLDPDEPMLGQADALYGVILRSWDQAQTQPIKMMPYPYPEGVDTPEFKESVQRGWKLFIGDDKAHPMAKATNCVSCHVNYGRQAKYRWDSWGTLVRPNNLTNGVYRGGRRTVDLYNRIHSGINGSGMAHFGSLQGTDSAAAPTKNSDPRIIWDLVNFVRVLPYPQMREKLGVNIDGPMPAAEVAAK